MGCGSGMGLSWSVGYVRGRERGRDAETYFSVALAVTAIISTTFARVCYSLIV